MTNSAQTPVNIQKDFDKRFVSVFIFIWQFLNLYYCTFVCISMSLKTLSSDQQLDKLIAHQRSVLLLLLLILLTITYIYL